MDPRALRRTFLWLFLGCLGLTALLAIVAVLSGDFGEFEARVLGSSASVSAASVCAMACAAFRERGRMPAFGTAGIVLAGLALLLVLAVIWFEPKPEREWIKATLLAVLYAAGAAHSQLLLLPPLAARHRWAQRVALGANAMLALLLSIMILWQPSGDGLGRSIAVLSIVVALLTLAIPILWKIGGASHDGGAMLHLQQQADGSWRDAAGRRYDVRDLDDGSAP